MNMAPKKGVKETTDKKKKQNNSGDKMKKSGGVAHTAATTTSVVKGVPFRPTSSANNRMRNAKPSVASNGPASAIPVSSRPSARFPSTASSARQPSAVNASAASSAAAASVAAASAAAASAATYSQSLVNNNDPPLPPGGGTTVSFEFYCDKDEITKNMCKDGTDLATSSRLQQIIQQIIDELLAAPDALPPLNILLTQILVSFVVDAIQNVLSNPTHRQAFDPNDKNIKNLFKMASNIVLTSLVTTGTVPTASTIVIRVLVKRSLVEQKNAPSLPAIGKKLALNTFKEAKKLLDKLDAFEPQIVEIIKRNIENKADLSIQGVTVGGSIPKTRTGGRKSRRGN